MPGVNDIYLTKARKFVIRLIPEIGYGFGLISMVVVDKLQQIGITKDDIPMTTKVLASCIREGFDDVDKLFFKLKNNLKSRVETHIRFSN